MFPLTVILITLYTAPILADSYEPIIAEKDIFPGEDDPETATLPEEVETPEEEQEDIPNVTQDKSESPEQKSYPQAT